MATLQSGSSPGQRIEAGESVIAASGSVSMKPVATRFAAFKKIHGAYRAADAKVKKANEALAKQQAKVGDADVAQDEAALDLAGALSADGLPRVNPFKAFGAPAPAALCKMGYGVEAEKLLELMKAVLKKKGLSSASMSKAKKMGALAKKVLAEIKPIAKLAKARANAQSAREALEQAWETAFAALKRGTKAAEDEGAKGLFAALFERTGTARSKTRAKKVAKKGVKASGDAPKGEATPT